MEYHCFCFNFYWKIVDLQCRVNFRYTALYLFMCVCVCVCVCVFILFEILFPYRLTLILIFFEMCIWFQRTSQVVLVVKNLPANAGDIRDTGSIPGVR